MMKPEEREELLRTFIDGEMTPAQERRALHAIAEDPELREMLRFERRLSVDLGAGPLGSGSGDVPDGFVDEVMSRIESLEPEPAAGSEPAGESPPAESAKSLDELVLEKLADVLEQMMKPRKFSLNLRPVWIPVGLLAVALLWSLAGPFGPSAGDLDGQPDGELATQIVSEAGAEVWVRFVYVDEQAERMEVAGDFSGWEPVELSPERIGDRQVWTAMVRLPRGEHNYMFIRNGEEWLTDPFATMRRDDGFGNENAVIYL